MPRFGGVFDITARRRGTIYARRREKNIVTQDGVEAMLVLFAGGTGQVAASPAVAATKRVYSLGLGIGGTWPLVRADEWINGDLYDELVNYPALYPNYARGVIAANSVPVTVASAHDALSTALFTYEWLASVGWIAAGETAALDEVGVFDPDGLLLAVSTFDTITADEDTDFEVRYTIGIEQDT